jgi:hypothetical protein
VLFQVGSGSVSGFVVLVLQCNKASLFQKKKKKASQCHFYRQNITRWQKKFNPETFFYGNTWKWVFYFAWSSVSGGGLVAYFLSCVPSPKPAQILTHTGATLFLLCLSLESLHYLGIWCLPSSQIKNVEKTLPPASSSTISETLVSLTNMDKESVGNRAAR